MDGWSTGLLSGTMLVSGRVFHSMTIGGGNSFFFIFTPIFVGEMIQFDVHIFSNGLDQPPTRNVTNVCLHHIQKIFWATEGPNHI